MREITFNNQKGRNTATFAGLGFESDATHEGDLYFYHADHLGSTTYTTDTAGHVSQFLCYTPYGESLVDEHVGSYESPFKFTAKEQDTHTGLYDHGARHRNPATTLWYGVDELFEDYPEISPFAYCQNNPEKKVDVDGRNPLLAMVASAGADYVFQVAINLMSGDSFEDAFVNNIDFGEIVISGVGGLTGESVAILSNKAIKLAKTQCCPKRLD